MWNPHVVKDTVENNEFLKRFKNVNSHRADIGEFVAIDYESTHVFQAEILVEANIFFEDQQAVNKDENITSDEPMDVDTPSQT